VHTLEVPAADHSSARHRLSIAHLPRYRMLLAVSVTEHDSVAEHAEAGSATCICRVSIVRRLNRTSAQLDVLWRQRLGAVGVGSVVDFHDDDGVVGVVDAQQDAVVATACAVETFEVVAQRFAEPVRIVGEGAGDELDDGVDDSWRESSEVAACRGRDFDVIRTGPGRRIIAHLDGMPCSARSSSREMV